jgi:deoxyribonuclease V
MIYCFDTYYFGDKAQTACVGIANWESGTAELELTETLDGVDAYESGAFYKRELPCLISILKQIKLNPQQDVIIIDGFVVLDDSGKPGLGAYLFDFFNAAIPVIGVAKNNFFTINDLKREVYRGESEKPLYVTAKGMDLDTAAIHIANMYGTFRIPAMLKLADTNCRKI